MKAGRELDGLVMDKVFGKPGWYHFADGAAPGLPFYSTKEDDAQLVWDKMAELCPSETYDKFLEYMPSFRASEVRPGTPIKFPKQFVPPEEICIAALKALGIDNAG